MPKPAKLAEIQRLTAKMVMRPLSRDMRTQKQWGDGRSTGDVAKTIIKPNDRLTAFDRIEIYNRQYWFRLIDCLYDDYPGVLAVIGQTHFDKLIRGYLEKYPSRSFTLRNLGDRLSQFIDEQPVLTGNKRSIVKQMAEFEWAQVVAFDGPEYPAVAVNDLAGKKPEKLKLGVQPYITAMELDWPLDDFSISLKKSQQALRGEASNAIEEREVHREKKVALPKKAKTYLAVHRHDNEIYFKRLDRLGYKLLTALGDGKTLAKAVEWAAKEEEDSGELGLEIQKWFSNWTELGWFYRRK